MNSEGFKELDEDTLHEKILARAIVFQLGKSRFDKDVILKALVRASRYWAQENGKTADDFTEVFTTNILKYVSLNSGN